MRGMLLVARRDLASFLNSYWGYGIIAAVLLMDGLFFNAFALGDNPKYSSKVMEDFFYYSFGLTCIATTFVTMRSIAEERQTGTEMLIESSPLSVVEFVGGKFLAGFAMMALLVLLTLYMPALVHVNGKVSYGQIFAGYLGLLLVASACVAIGVFTSSLSRYQLVAVILAAFIIGFFVMAWLLAKVVDPPLKDIISYLGFYDRHFRNFGRGQIHTESVIYFVSLTFMFLVAATRFLSIRRWR